MSGDVKCPKCSGPTWDNTKDKSSAKAPDYRCKDRANCDGAIWLDKLDKKKPAQRPATALTPSAAAPWPPLPRDTPAEATASKPAPSVSICADWLSALDMVLEKGLPKLKAKGIEADASAVFAATATVFIAKQGKR